MTALGVKPATRHPRVVEFMIDIIRFVEELIEKGFAYESQGDVYFRVENPTTMTKLANKTLEDFGARCFRSYPMKKRLVRKIL